MSSRLAGWVVGIALVGMLTGCDIPTEGPSVQTDIELSTPLLAEKTFSFLGGPQSKYETLVDTTTSTFDSLFSVGEGGADLRIEQTVDQFETGGLDGVLRKAGANVRIDTSLAGALVEGSSLEEQNVTAQYQEKTEIFGSDRATVGPQPVVDRDRDEVVQVPFPTRVLHPPTSGVVDASGATVRSVKLTQATLEEGRAVNRITFRLENKGPRPLTDGEGGAPTVAVIDAATGAQKAQASFGTPIPSAASGTARVAVAGEDLGEQTAIRLRVGGTGPPSTVSLTTEIAPLRYDAATLTDLDEVVVEAEETAIETEGTGASRFAGIIPAAGHLRVEVENTLSFPITMDRFEATNHAGMLRHLPSSFPALGFTKKNRPVRAQGTTTLTSSIMGRGLARRVDGTLEGRPAPELSEITVRSGRGLKITAQADPTIRTMYFWPKGEHVTQTGTYPVPDGRLQFERPGDFLELMDGTLRLEKLMNELDVSFERFLISYPGIRRAPYARADSLVIRFEGSSAGPGRFEFAALGRGQPPRTLSASLQNFQLRPHNNILRYRMRGTLETIPDHRIPEAPLRVVRQGQAVDGQVQVKGLEARAVQGRVQAFQVPVTPDVNGDGRLDVGRDAEAAVASLQGFDDLARRVEGLQFASGMLRLSVDTDLGADTRLFAAFQGRTAEGPLYLAGKGRRAVSTNAPAAISLLNEGQRIPTDRLLQVNVDGTSDGNIATRTTALTTENSTVRPFINALPSSVRFAATALVKDGRIRGRSPVMFTAGLNVEVPVRLKGTFVLRDTIDAGFERLDALTDPDKTVTVSSAALQLEYTNEIPLGADVTMTVVDGDGNPQLEFTASDDNLRIAPAPKGSDGAASGTESGTIKVVLSKTMLREMATGEAVHLRMQMKQQEGPPVRIRSDDTLRLSMNTDIDATVQSK